HLGFALQRRAKLDGPGLLCHGINEFVVDRLLNQDATAGGTDLALVDEHAEQRAVDGGFEIGVRKKYVRRFSSQLEGHALYGLCGLLHNDLADVGAAGEGDFIYVRMFDQGSATSFAKAGDDVYNSGWKPNFGKPIRHLERSERSLLRRLQNASAASSQRWRQLPRSHKQRIIPGNDLSGDADGFFQG